MPISHNRGLGSSCGSTSSFSFLLMGTLGILESLPLVWKPEFLALACPSPSCCKHWGSKPVEGESLSLSKKKNWSWVFNTIKHAEVNYLQRLVLLLTSLHATYVILSSQPHCPTVHFMHSVPFCFHVCTYLKCKAQWIFTNWILLFSTQIN